MKGYLDTDHSSDEHLSFVTVRYSWWKFVLVNEFLGGENHFKTAESLIRVAAGRHELVVTDLQQPEFEVAWTAVTIRVTCSTNRHRL